MEKKDKKIVDDICFDTEAYKRFPHLRKWFNKLYVAETFGYLCGPAGISVPKDDMYIVRPIYNLRGLGCCASKRYLTTSDLRTVPPGYFWVEVFNGYHYSIDYIKKDGVFEQLNCFIGDNDPTDLYRFYSWKKSDHVFDLPEQLKRLDVDLLNIEVIGNKIVEVHLRLGMDHVMQYEEIIPVWNSESTTKEGYEFKPCLSGHDDGDGWLDNKRIGFLCR